MKDFFISLFRCPVCRLPLAWSSRDANETIILQGACACKNGHIFHVRDGIPDFTSPQHTNGYVEKSQDTSSVESFGFEWQWDHTPRTEEDLLFRVFEKPNIPRDFFQGKLVLDMGCGAGLQTKMMARHGATVVGVDLSEAVRAAYRNTHEFRETVCIARADIFSLPFEEATFDYVYCEGVLQHTKDPREAFNHLVRFVKPGGQIFATFYTRREGWFAPFLFFRQPLRLVLSKLPQKWCWYICWISIPLNRIPVLQYLFRKTIVLYDKRNPSNKAIWCLNYDFYGPHKYQFYFRPSEIRKIWQDAPHRLTVLHSEYGYPLRGKRE